jgi:hypothetical protein
MEGHGELVVGELVVSISIRQVPDRQEELRGSERQETGEETCGSKPLLEKTGMMKDWDKNLRQEEEDGVTERRRRSGEQTQCGRCHKT